MQYADLLKDIVIRQEEETNYEAVFSLIKSAFALLEISDHKEQFLVERLRKSKSFIPELSLVAEIEGKIVGHILLTEIIIKNEENELVSLALAPVSVLPEYQGEGIGGKLIEHAHQEAKRLQYQSVVILGHPKYYTRFGYVQADKFGISLPFEVPTVNCMVIALSENGLDNVHGTVVYPSEFFG